MSYTAARRQEEKEQRRNEILDAAEEVFGRDGVEAATLGAVAKNARLSRSLLYFYFKDKEDLIFAVAQRGLRLLNRLFEEAAARHARGIDQIEAMGRAYYRYARKHPVYFEVLARFEAHDIDLKEMGENEAACLMEGNRVFDVMAQSLVHGMQDGSVRADLGDPLQTALTLWAFTHGLGQITTNKESMLRRHHGIATADLVEHAFAGMRRGLSCARDRWRNRSSNNWPWCSVSTDPTSSTPSGLTTAPVGSRCCWRMRQRCWRWNPTSPGTPVQAASTSAS